MRFYSKALLFLLVFICSCATKNTTNKKKQGRIWQKEYTSYVTDLLENKKYDTTFIQKQSGSIDNIKFKSESFYKNQFVNDAKGVKYIHTVALNHDLVTIVNRINSLGNVITQNIYSVRSPKYDSELSYTLSKNKVQFGIDGYPIKIEDVIEIFTARKKIQKSEFGIFNNALKLDPEYSLIDEGIYFFEKSGVWSIQYMTSVGAVLKQGKEAWVMTIDAKTGNILEDVKCTITGETYKLPESYLKYKDGYFRPQE